MSNPPGMPRFALALLVYGCACIPARSAEQPGSHTVIGEANPLLSDGAAALEAGRIEEGIRLTLAGLKVAVNVPETAAGHSNACAGYALLKQWDDALVQCNAALGLDTTNWRIYNNRAAIYVQKGLYELALRDLQAGLVLAPGSPTLHESLRILERNKRLSGGRGRKEVPA